jgi:conjugal transfer pilus assembly protein TraB
LVLMILFGKRDPTTSERMKAPGQMKSLATAAPGDGMGMGDLWLATSEKKITTLEQDNADMRRRLEQQEKTLAELTGNTPTNSANSSRQAKDNPLDQFELTPHPEAAKRNQQGNQQGNAQGAGSSGSVVVDKGFTQPIQKLNQKMIDRATSPSPTTYPPQTPSVIGQSNGQNNGQTTIFSATQGVSPTPLASFQPPAPRGFVTVELASAANKVNVATGTTTGAATVATTGAATVATTATATKETKTPNTPEKTPENYLGIGFLRARILGGLDAPTAGSAQQQPHPVLMQVIDDGQLANRFRVDVKECFVIAAGYGDLSTERAYIRTESLSCIRPDGGLIEISINGSVFGEDGKNGLRGRLVTKQGALLANAFASGVASGIGRMTSQQAFTTSQTALGTTQTLDSSRIAQAGLGQGINIAMDRLSRYYISLAEKMFPIIEIDANRTVDIVITKGTPMDAAKVRVNTRGGSYAGSAYDD